MPKMSFNALKLIDCQYKLLFSKTKDRLDWHRLLSETELIYTHPTLETRLGDLALCCEYAIDRAEPLNVDQLCEVMECIDLLVRNDAAISQWLRIYKESVKGSDQRRLQLLEISLKQLSALAQPLWGNELDNCAFVPIPFSTKEIPTPALLKTVGYLNIPRDEDGAPHILETKGTGERFLVGYLSTAFPWQGVDPSLVCLVTLDQNWEQEDILNLKTVCYAIPVFLTGRSVQVDTSDYKGHSQALRSLRKAGGKGIIPYFLLKVPEEHRLAHLIVEYQLEDIIWKSKLDILKDYPKELLAHAQEVSASDQRLYQLLASNAETYQGSLEGAIACRTTEELVAYLTSFFSQERVNSVARIEKPLWVLERFPLGTQSFDSKIVCVFVLNLLLKLSLLHEVSYLQGAKVGVCLVRQDTETGLFSCDDEGDFVFLSVQSGSASCVIAPFATKPLTIVARRMVSLYVPFGKRVPGDERALFKYVIAQEDIPDIAGVWWGNMVASVAMLSVGAVELEIKDAYLDSVAAIIELEDRPSKTANLPDPWPYNLSKVLRVIEVNPNVRYLIVIAEEQYCAETLERIEHRRVLQSSIHRLIADDLVIGFKQQILHTLTLQRTTLKHLLCSIGREIQKAYLEDMDAAWKETGCLETDHFANVAKSASISVPSLNKLVDIYIQEYVRTGRVLTSVELVADTVKTAYPGILATILKYGEDKGPDSLQRMYKDVFSHRIVIKHTDKDLVTVGLTEREVEGYYQQEWLDAKGLFNTRLRESFGIDQIDKAIGLIVSTIEAGLITRSVILNVHHPSLDRRRPLGLNEIYFAFRPLSDKQCMIVGTFVWRSVEALFGLPYSIYASCRFQRFIVEACNARLRTEYRVVCGETIYMSLNLHLYQDDLNREIAGKIIQDALDDLTKQG